MNKYKIVYDQDLEEFQKKVQEELSKGWILQGGVCIDECFYQAMVR